MKAIEHQRMSTGVDGLDEILLGGIEPRRTYLVEGKPGAGKTTLALQWLIEGAARGERCLHISLSETGDELRASMESHGWSTDDENLALVALNVAEGKLQRENQYTMYHPAEVELGEMFDLILAEVDRIEPHRVVVDSLSEVRLLSQDPLRFRHQILGLKQYLANHGCTALLVSQEGPEHQQTGLHSLVHGVISLRQTIMGFGAARRQLQVVKMRGRDYRDGVYDFAIRRGGIQVFPPLVAAGNGPRERSVLASGKEGLDVLLGGGLTRGTSTLLMGPTGSGKSIVATQYVVAALDRGQRAVVLTFDEHRDLFLTRAAGIGLDLAGHVASGALAVEQVDPGQLSPGEFAHRIRTAVEHEERDLVVIDSLNGFLSSMPEERFLLIHLHEVLSYLATRDVTSILTNTQPATSGHDGSMAVNATYLSDATVVFRYFETDGEVRKALSVLKKRMGGHEKSIRELHITSNGIDVSAPLMGFQGILSGLPILQGTTSSSPGHDAS